MKNEVHLNEQTAGASGAPEETRIYLLLDNSGSMGRDRSKAISAINDFLEDLKKEEGYVEVSLTLFNENITRLYLGQPLHECPPLTEAEYAPSGTTALFDAIGSSLTEASQEAGTNRVIVCILTDGKENSSRRYTLPEIRELISRKEKEGWDITYLSSHADAFLDAHQMGLQRQKSIKFEKTEDGFAETKARMVDMVNQKRKFGMINGGLEATPPAAFCDDGATGGRHRGSLSLRFWQGLIRSHPEKGSRIHAHCFPTPARQLAAAGSVPGGELVYTIYPRSAIVSFRVARNDGVTNPFFERLAGERARITEAFGGDLEFYEGKERKYDYIRIVLRNGGLNNQKIWPSIHAEMIETMERLNAAIAGVV